jgi:pyruvate dehydrogenase E1 component beta subunit
MLFIDFLLLAMDQVINQAAKYRFMSGGEGRVPLVIRTQGGTGNSLAGQHSQSLEALYYHIPGLKVVMPSTPRDAKGLLIAAIRDDDPVIFCENKVLYDVKGEVPEGEYVIPLGLADVKRVGSDVTIVAISRMVHVALQAAEQLAREGISAEVVDPRTLSPLDEDTLLDSIRKTGRLVVVDEDNPRCSVATDIASLAATRVLDYLNAPVRLVTAPHTPVPFSPSLEDFYIPTPERVVDAARSTIKLAAGV